MTVATSLFDRVQAAAGVGTRVEARVAPEVGIILGTGLGGLAREIAAEAEIPTRTSRASRCPRSRPTPASCCRPARRTAVVAMEGRFHRYEGYTSSR